VACWLAGKTAAACAASQDLDLRNNLLRTVPSDLGWLVRLKHLYMAGNTRTPIPPGVHALGFK
jgi:hypothetical protein